MVCIHHTAEAEDVIARQQLCVILHPNERDGDVSISGNNRRGRVSAREALWINRKSKLLPSLNTQCPYVTVAQYHEGLNCTLNKRTIIVRINKQHLMK